jgi:hypothetical protein
MEEQIFHARGMRDDTFKVQVALIQAELKRKQALQEPNSN